MEKKDLRKRWTWREVAMQRAILHLNRAIKRDATSEPAQRAAAVLQEVEIGAAD